CNTGADLVVTPETTIPIFFGKEKELTQIVLEELKDCRSNIILGVIDYIEEGKIRVYLNKAVHIKEGSVVAEYTKNILVPFGEYVPFRNILTELIKNVSWPEDFKEGDKLIPFNINGYVSVTPICYEICFPFYMAQYKKEFIISLTNDMWFGKTIAPYLHLWAGSLRSVENRSYIIRSANTGISAIIDPKGYQLLATKLFEPEIAVKTIQTVEPKDTVFQQVPYLSLVLCFLILIRSLI
ncbi:MAG: apolipoprotein N-acyltransferase, partial [candidate division WOR-3 bacterium]